MDRKRERGFTLIEMLVVIGIIAILAGSLIAGFGSVSKSAQRAKAQEAVSNAATALSLFYQRNGEWGAAIETAAGNGQPRMTVEVAKVLGWGRPSLSLSQGQNYLGINFKKNGEESGNITLLGTDRCGIADPWAINVLKRSKDASLATPVPSGGTVEDHLICFAVDLDGDGIVEARLEGGTRKIRATAVAWCAGRDGKFAPISQMGRSDDVYSWQRGQEAK